MSKRLPDYMVLQPRIPSQALSFRLPVAANQGSVHRGLSCLHDFLGGFGPTVMNRVCQSTERLNTPNCFGY